MKKVKEFIVKFVFPEDGGPDEDYIDENTFVDIMFDALLYFDPEPKFDIISQQIREVTPEETRDLDLDEEDDNE